MGPFVIRSFRLMVVSQPLVSRPDAPSSRFTAVRQKYDPRYWVIHGRSYDLTNFVDRHPGGAYLIELGKGRDCTELFESVHAVCGVAGPRNILKKYEVEEQPIKEDLFSWRDDGFYSVLRDRVHQRFKGRNYKATWFVLAKIVVLVSLYLACWTAAFRTGHWAFRCGQWYLHGDGWILLDARFLA